MARMRKAEVIAALRAAGVEVHGDEKYNDLCRLLKANTDAPAKPTEQKEDAPAGTVRIENRRKKRNTFLADSVRDDDDKRFLNAEISQRKYKGKLKTITTIKHYDVIDGAWLTEFIIDLKE